MTAVEKIKVAAAKLNPDEQYELFRWRTESESFKERHLAALKRDLASGILQLETGRYQLYDDSTLLQLREQIKNSGLERLKKGA